MRFISLLCSVLLFTLSSCFDNEDPNAQLNAEIKAIDAYLEANENDYIAYSPNGIRIVVHQFGQLPPPQLGQKVRIALTGKLLSSGNVFTTKSFSSKLDSIGGTGLQFAISAIMGGSHATMYIPSKYGFGSSQSGDVPPNSTLVYEVNLYEVTRTTAQQTQFETDTAAIHSYIRTNNIQNVTYHPSGLCYSVTTVGTGTYPKVYDAIIAEYEGSLLTSATNFDSGQLNTGLFGLIDGFKVGMPLLNVGTSATLFIPSGLGYGTAASAVIPANSNLKFKVKLTTVN